MLDFSAAKSISIPEGNVVKIHAGDTLIWQQKQEESYTELDYIIVNKAYFNTGVIPSADKWTYEARIYPTSWGSNHYYYFAVRQTKDYSTMYAPIHIRSGTRMYLSGTQTASGGGAKNTWYTVKSEIQDGLQNMWVNDVLKVTDDLAIPTTYTRPLFLFAANFHGGRYGNYEGRISWLKIHHGDTLVRDFVAAKRDSDGVCGLLDRVENKFYTNAETTGTVTGV